MTTKTLRQKRQEKRRQEVLDAALAVFSDKGYAGASVEEIAERALLTRAALYKYFPDKLSLLTTLRQQKMSELAQRVDQGVGEARDFSGKVRAIIRETLCFQDEQHGFFRILFSASAMPEVRDRALEPFAAVLIEVIQAGIDRGELRDTSAEELAMLLAALTLKNSIKRIVIGQEPSTTTEQDAALIEEVFLRGAAR